MTTFAIQIGEFPRDPAEALDAPVSASGCCGSPTTTALLEQPQAATCCGTVAEAQAEGGCCGTAAKQDAVASGAGCCG